MSQIDQFAPGIQMKAVIPASTSFSGGHFVDLEWSPGGEALGIAPDDGGAIYVWRAESGDLDAAHYWGFAGVMSVAWSLDGKKLLAGCYDGTILVRGADDFEELLQTNLCGESLGSTASSAGWLAHDSRFLTLHTDGVVGQWDAGSGDLINEERLGGGGPWKDLTLLMSADRQRCIVAQRDYSRNYPTLDTRTLEMVAVLEGVGGSSGKADWSSSGHYLAKGNYYSPPTVWDVQTGECVVELDGPRAASMYLAFSPDESLLAGTARDNVLRIWRCGDWKLMAQIADLDGGLLGGLAFHPSEPILASGAEGGHRIKLWEYDLFELLH